MCKFAPSVGKAKILYGHLSSSSEQGPKSNSSKVSISKVVVGSGTLGLGEIYVMGCERLISFLPKKGSNGRCLLYCYTTIAVFCFCHF